MKYLVPDEVTVIHENERDNFDLYMIRGGGIHCHRIEIRPNMDLVIRITQVKPYADSQDNTLKCWFSEMPFQQSIILTPPLDRMTVRRRPIEITLNTTILSAGAHFLNVQNLENRENAYECVFTYE